MKPEAFARVKQQLRIDEGVRLVVYKDTLGYPTVGVGHLVVPEDNLVVGQSITHEQCEAFFTRDLERTVTDCEARLAGWEAFPEEIQEVLVNMAYNLGMAGLLKFVTTLGLLRKGLYAQAADALVNSRWYGQVGDRSKRLVARVRACVAPPVVAFEDKETPHLQALLQRPFLCRYGGSPAVVEMTVLRFSPSGDYMLVSGAGWMDAHDFPRTVTILEFLNEPPQEETPWVSTGWE